MNDFDDADTALVLRLVLAALNGDHDGYAATLSEFATCQVCTSRVVAVLVGITAIFMSACSDSAAGAVNDIERHLVRLLDRIEADEP